MPPLLVAATLWWIGFLMAAGLCIGSFLNVVIYRLPRNRSLSEPLWSACPHCGTRIRWYDNLPILSYLLLCGRCRKCTAPISSRYVIIEAMMAVVVLLLLDAFFVGKVRVGLGNAFAGLTEQLAVDWPIFAAHVVLFACLLSMSAIDMEHYWVDIRFTNLATWFGFAMHILWTPRHSLTWVRPGDTTGAVCLAALAGLGLVWILVVCSPHIDAEDYGLSESDSDIESSATPSMPDEPIVPPPPAGKIGAGLSVILLVGLMTSTILLSLGLWEFPFGWRAVPPLIFFLWLILRASVVVRESDERIIAEIHEERHTARSVALAEFGMLLPAILLAGLTAWLLISGDADWSRKIHETIHTRIPVHSVNMMRGWMPLYGLATAASGYIMAGALGWAVRIFFTLLFGKEAFGSGDIHMMAAAGCVCGWPVVVLGFILTCGLAMFGWLVALPFKRSRAIPLGPWLALSFLIVVVFYEPIVQSTPVRRAVEAAGLIEYRLFHENFTG